MPETVRVAAVQLSATVGDVAGNLGECEKLAGRAAQAGAAWIVLPEFFTTGMAYDARLHDAAQPADGDAFQMMSKLALRHGVYVGGSFLCSDAAERRVHNAFLLVGPDGRAVGRHDKDLPTMWENCFYEGGSDDGVIGLPDGRSAGVAMCWELIRSQTARRLRGRVDITIGGSCWWTVPDRPPRPVTRAMEARNAVNAVKAASLIARMTGAPVVHAAHCGPIECRIPWTGLRYRGHAEGGTAIFDADGNAMALRAASEGAGVVTAEVAIERRNPAQPVPDDYWLVDRGILPSIAWNYQGRHGRAEYARWRGSR